MTLAECKGYLRITDDMDDALLEGIMMPAAAEYMESAFGSFDETKIRMKCAYLAVLQDIYDNRELVARTGTVDKNLIQKSLGIQFLAEELLGEEGG